jgi:hypothetical protein
MVCCNDDCTRSNRRAGPKRVLPKLAETLKVAREAFAETGAKAAQNTKPTNSVKVREHATAAYSLLAVMLPLLQCMTVDNCSPRSPRKPTSESKTFDLGHSLFKGQPLQGTCL